MPEENKNPLWERIPVPIESENDRRTLCAILTANGLSVRIVKIRLTQRGTPKRFVEYKAPDEAEA